jgi:hypothetical protein
MKKEKLLSLEKRVFVILAFTFLIQFIQAQSFNIHLSPSTSLSVDDTIIFNSQLNTFPVNTEFRWSFDECIASKSTPCTDSIHIQFGNTMKYTYQNTGVYNIEISAFDQSDNLINDTVITLYVGGTLYPCNSLPNSNCEIVCNGGFEDYIPNSTINTSQIYKAYSWTDWATIVGLDPGAVIASSPDLFGIGNNFQSSVAVPNNAEGHQIPRSGLGYAGFFGYEFYPDTMGATESQYYEIIIGKLPQALKQNQNYYVEFYVSLAEHSISSIDNIGMFIDNYYTINDPNKTFTDGYF